MLFTEDMGYVAPEGVTSRRIAEYPVQGCLWASEMTVGVPQLPGEERPAPFGGQGRNR